MVPHYLPQVVQLHVNSNTKLKWVKWVLMCQFLCHYHFSPSRAIKVDAVESITEDAVSTDTVVATLTVHDTDTPEDELTVLLENNSNGKEARI